MAKYSRSGAPNEAAPEITQYLGQYLMIPASELRAKCWSELQNWLARELGFYRALSVETGTPTEQKRELKKYLQALEAVEHYLSTEDFLPPSIIGKIHMAEYRHDITHDTDWEVHRYLIKKRLLAEGVLQELEAFPGRAGTSSTAREYRLLHSLADRIIANLNTVGTDEVLVTAAHILNDPLALGCLHEPFGSTAYPQTENPRLLSSDPKQIRRQLASHGLTLGKARG